MTRGSEGGSGERTRTGGRVELREWTVGGGLLLRPERARPASVGEVLLVRNRRRNGAVDWTTPGGVIEGGEDLVAGLAREVREETGLAVSRWEGPLYRVEVLAMDLRWKLTVEVHRGYEVSGDIRIDDPDGIVEDVRYVGLDECRHLLAGTHRWASEPLLEYLESSTAPDEVFRYEVAGTDPASFRIRRM
ncbi:MAG TPA: NUDIX hydrolase [Acidimicrobiales bacterium]|nr:NUDIX hydrolase [Acidimicrobiales bacterium]